MISTSPPTIVPFFTYSSTSPANRRTASAETPWLSGVATGKAAFSWAAADTLIGPNHTAAIQIAVRWHERARLLVLGTLACVTLSCRTRHLVTSWMSRVPAGAGRAPEGHRALEYSH